MFRLRQTTRRQLCRAGFLLGCLLPIMALVLWGTYRHTSVYGHQQEWVLRQISGLRVRVGGVAHPRPGVVRYRDVELADAETQKPVASCALVEVRRPTLNGPTRLTITGLTLERGGLAACYALLQRHIRHEREDDLNVLLTVEGVTIPDAPDPALLARINGSLRTSEQGSEARLVIEPATATELSSTEASSTERTAADAPTPPPDATSPTAEKILLRVARVHDPVLPSSEWELHTGRHLVPCSWLTVLTGELPGLKESQFQGSLWSKDAETGGQAAVKGRLTQVNLAELIGKRFGQVLEGMVDVEFVQPAHYQGGRVVDLLARVTGGPGRVERSLLAATSAALGCAPTFDPRGANGVFSFEQLALELRVNARGQLVVVGRVPDRPGIILAGDNGQPLLLEPTKQPQPAVNLVRALAPIGGPTIPATPEAARLLGWLPTGATQVPATATRPNPPAPSGTNPAAGQRR